MPVGMVEAFKGTQFWKMPANVEINVGPTIIEELPKGYTDATEKYSHLVRVVHLPNGHNDIVNYVAGEPFPSPEEPDKGYSFWRICGLRTHLTWLLVQCIILLRPALRTSSVTSIV